MAVRNYFAQFGSGDPRTYTGLNPTFIFFVNGAGATLAPPSIAEQYVGTGMYRFQYDALTTIAFLLDGATTGLATGDRYVTGVLDPLDNVFPYFQGFSSALSGISNQVFATGMSLVASGVTQVSIGNNVLAVGTTLVAQGSTLVGVGTTLTAIGNTLTSIGFIGSSLSALGLTLTDIGNRVGFTTCSYGDTSVDPGTLFGFLKRNQEFWEGQQIYTKSTGILQFFIRGSGSSLLLRQATVTDDTSETERTS